MKTYNVKLLTQNGIVERIVTEGDDLQKLSEEIQKLHGDFTTLSSEEIK